MSTRITSAAFRTAMVLSGLLVCEVTAVFGQTPAAQPGSRSLFGGTGGRSGSRPQLLDLTVSVAGAYDDDLGNGQSTPSTLYPRVGGQYSDLRTTLSLTRTRSHFGITAGAASSLRHYPALNSFVGSTHSAGANLTIELNRHTTFRTGVDGSYVSELAFDTFSRELGFGPASPSPTGFESAALDATRMSYGGAAGLTRALGKRSSVALTYGVRESERQRVAERAVEQSVGSQFARTIGRDASVRFEYNVRSGTRRLRGETSPMSSHDVQLGVERRWRHSRVRRTIVNLAAGPSLLQEGPSALHQLDRVRQVRVVGTVAFNHEMGGGFRAGASYRRGAALRQAQVFSNTFAFDLRDEIGRRVELTVSAGYSDGELELNSRQTMLQNRIGTSFGSTRVRLALTRGVAVYSEYFLYHYDLGAGTPEAAYSPSQIGRRGFRAGLALWMPLHEGR